MTANEAMRPYRVWRHDSAQHQADDTLVFEETDERFYVYVGLSRSGDWVIIDSRCKTFSEVLLIPADDPKSDPIVVRPRTDDIEYSVDHWGDKFVILTNLDAEDFRVMTASIDAPSVWSELVGHHSGRRIVAIEPFAGHLVLHEWSTRSSACGCCSARAASASSISATSRTRSRSMPTPNGTPTRSATAISR